MEESGANSAKNAEKKAKKDAEKAAKEAEKKKREDELQAARDAKTKGPDVRPDGGRSNESTLTSARDRESELKETISQDIFINGLRNAGKHGEPVIVEHPYQRRPSHERRAFLFLLLNYRKPPFWSSL